MRLPYRKPGKYSQQAGDALMTEAKFAELKEDLERLKKAQPAAAAEVARLAEMGDFSENAEYQLAKGRLRGINHRILKLEYEVNHAEIISAPQASDLVRVGMTVTVAVRGNEKTYQILGSSETDPARGIISHTSPLGMLLIGRRVGEKVMMKETEYMIVKIV